jgi:hypothetical protein
MFHTSHANIPLSTPYQVKNSLKSSLQNTNVMYMYHIRHIIATFLLFEIEN